MGSKGLGVVLMGLGLSKRPRGYLRIKERRCSAVECVFNHHPLFIASNRSPTIYISVLIYFTSPQNPNPSVAVQIFMFTYSLNSKIFVFFVFYTNFNHLSYKKIKVIKNQI
jgi:hypothetical protein